MAHSKAAPELQMAHSKAAPEGRVEERLQENCHPV